MIKILLTFYKGDIMTNKEKQIYKEMQLILSEKINEPEPELNNYREFERSITERFGAENIQECFYTDDYI